MKKTFTLLTGLAVLITFPLRATEYYVDFSNGCDTLDGLAQSSAWKHCPGDRNATGNPASVQLKAGDIVIFKGGVVYAGEIYLKHDGAGNNPILYKGDGWGTEKAIIDGSETIASHWTQCQDASDCRNNDHYANIYYTDLPEGFDFFSGFYEDNEFLWFGQDPNPSDRFNYDNIDDFYEIPLGRHFSTTELTDSAYFNQSDPLYWQGSYIIAWHIPNVTTTHSITAFDPVTCTITFDDLGGGGIYTDRKSYYAILNHPVHIDQPGEYCVDTIQNRIYLWPLHSDNPNGHTYAFRTRQFGIVYTRRKNIVIEGFEIRNGVMGIRSDNNETENIIIRNNVVRNLRSNNWYAIQMRGKNITVEKNRVEDCIRSVGILAAGENLAVKENYVKNTSRQGIWFMGVNRGTITGNTVTDIRGTHSNGISVYLYNENILVAGNRVLNSNLSFTFEGDNSLPELHINLTVYNNYFENSCHGWGHNAKAITVINNVCREGFFYSDTDTLTVSLNNIFHGGGDADLNRNNLYTDLGWWQQSRYGWSLQEGEIDWSENDIHDVYADIANGDVHLRLGSPAIDSGINPIAFLPVDEFPEYDFYRDLFGNVRPRGKAWDIGGHEYDNGPDLSKGQCLFDQEPLIAFPNPVDKSLTIYHQGNCEIKLYNITGDLIYEGADKSIDFSACKSGVYLMKIQDNDDICVIKVVKN